MTVYLVLYTVDALKKHKTTMYIHIYIHTNWWFQPPEKILVRLDHYPNYWGKTCSKPPTSIYS